VGSPIALTLTIVSSVFGLAEWRIRDALTPIDRHLERLDKALHVQAEIIGELNRAREDQRVRVGEIGARVDRFDRAISWHPRLDAPDAVAAAAKPR
jgi:hypothetical protein